MKLRIEGLLLTILALIFIAQTVESQVIVRCPKGNFNNSLKFRCVPTQESTLDTVLISDCDCNDPLNIYYPLALCHRTITFKADSLIIPDDINAFDFPYFDLDPISLGNLYGQDGEPLLNFLDPDGFINPYLEKGDTLEAGIILPIDTESKSITLDVWIPFGESASFNLYIGFDEVRNVLNQYFTIPPSDPCGIYIEECYDIHREFDASDNKIYSQKSIIISPPPINGKISKIELLNISLNDPSYMINLSGTLYHEFSFKKIEFFNGIQIANDSLNVGFSDESDLPYELLQTASNTVDQSIYKPSERFAPLYNYSSSEDIDGDFFNLILKNSFANPSPDAIIDSLDLRVCYNQYNSCGPYKEVYDAALSIPDQDIVESVISVSDHYANQTIYAISIDNIKITHTWIGDLKISLQGPDGTTAVLIDRLCSSDDNMSISFSSTADDLYADISCPINNLRTYRPKEDLAIFDGKQINGDWKLIIEDEAASDIGTLESWTLGICTCRQYCDCPDSYSTAQNNNIQGSIYKNRTYQTDGIIESEEIISGEMTTVQYQSGSNINLSNPFEVKAGATFIAEQGGCPE